MYGLNHLQDLDVSDNRLDSLPDTIGQLGHLRFLDLRNNNFSVAPDCLAKLKGSLQELYIGDNPLPATEIEKIKAWLPNTLIEL